MPCRELTKEIAREMPTVGNSDSPNTYGEQIQLTVTNSAASADPLTDSHRRALLVGLALAVLPAFTLFDLVRPALFEARTLGALAEASGSSEPAIDTVDYVVLALLAGFIICAAALVLANRRRILARAALAAWTCALAMLCVELAFYLAARPYVFPPRMRRTFDSSPEIMPGIIGPSSFTTNEIGMRGPEWKESAYKVLCIGGSTTICTYLDDKETWPQQLMQILNEQAPGRDLWVGNVGKSGHDTYHHIELLLRLPEARNVDCCLILCGVNDFKHALRLPDDIRLRLAPSRVFALGGPWDPTRPYLKQTYIYRSAKALLGFSSPGDVMEVEDREGQTYVLRRQVRRAASKDYPLPPLEAHLLAYRDNLKRIADLCAERSVRCIFLTQPTMWRRGLPAELESLLWNRPLGASGRALSAADLAKGMMAYNRTMRDYCTSEAIEFIDLADVAPKDSTVFYDDEHFNESGAKLIATIIAGYLLDHNGN